MSLKMKLVSSIAAALLVIALLVTGVFALQNPKVKVGGNVTFTAVDVHAKITLTAGDTNLDVKNGEAAPADFTIENKTTATGEENEVTAWSGLTFTIKNGARKVYFDVTIENLSTDRRITVGVPELESGDTSNSFFTVEFKQAGNDLASSTENFEELTLTATADEVPATAKTTVRVVLTVGENVDTFNNRPLTFHFTLTNLAGTGVV